MIGQLRKDQDLKIESLKKDQDLKMECLEKENIKLKQKMDGMVELDKFHESNQMILFELKSLQNINEEMKNELQIQRENIT